MDRFNEFRLMDKTEKNACIYEASICDLWFFKLPYRDGFVKHLGGFVKHLGSFVKQAIECSICSIQSSGHKGEKWAHFSLARKLTSLQ